MTESYRATDPAMPDLTKCKTINWPERMVTMELHLTDLQASLKEMQTEARYAMVSLAESNEKLANHFEEAKRVHQRMDEHDAMVSDLREELVRLEKTIIELKMQNQVLIDFSCGVKKAGWIAVTCGGVVVWWVLQKWLEHGR